MTIAQMDRYTTFFLLLTAGHYKMGRLCDYFFKRVEVNDAT
jgi:hypothetical protein